jgi:hypothetical protein
LKENGYDTNACSSGNQRRDNDHLLL